MNEVSLWYHPVLEALGYAIFHSLWQSVLLFFPLQLLLLFVKGAGQRYRLLFGSFSVIFLVFVITFCMELNESIASQHHYIALTQNISKDSLAATANQLIGIAPKHWWQHFTGFYHDPHFKQILPVISICYVMGILVLGLRLMLSFRNIKAIRRDVQLAPMPLQERFSSLVKLIAIKRKVSLYFSEKINVPMMMGHLKPMVILPLALINQLDWQQTEAVLIHELAHVKRMDYLLNILQSVMEMLMFFNPMIWWLSAIIRKEREHCCDDMAVLHTDQPVKYAEALLQLELSKNRLQPAMAATGNNKKYSLLNRIKRIVEMKTNSKRSPQSILAALTALMFIAAFCCYYSAVAQEKAPNPPKPATQEQTYVAPPPPPQSPVVISDEESPEAPEAPESPEAPEAPEMDATIHNAMNAANTALKQIKWDEVNDAMKQAGKGLSKVEFREMNDDIRQSMKEAQKEIAAAQKELNGQDMAMVGNSLAIASDALKAIDWDEIGDNINTSLASIKYLDTKEMKDAMKEVKVAMKQARAETLKASNDLKVHMDSIKVVRVMKMDQLSDERQASVKRAMVIRNEALANAQKSRDDAFRQTQQARMQVFEAKQAARAGNESTSKNDRLLKQLEEDGFINRNERFAVSYKNNTLMVNGTQVDTKRYQSNLPQSSNAKLSISGNKNKLAISLKE
jgi:beta-lactamase regulating signal transducer with metallopeptidase domain